MKKWKTIVLFLSPTNSFYAVRDEEEGEITLRVDGPTETLMQDLQPFEQHIPATDSLITVD